MLEPNKTIVSMNIHTNKNELLPIYIYIYKLLIEKIIEREDI